MRPYAILIPARHASSRLPGKMLLAESGMPLIAHVAARAREAPDHGRVLVLTDDERIGRAVAAHGGAWRLTRADHASGTDRCAEAAADLDEAVVVNLQGDEPFFAPGDLARLAAEVEASGADIATLGWPFEVGGADVEDPHAVKAVVGPEGEALDFTRSAERARERAAAGGGRILHHVGIYAFRRERLLAFPDLPAAPREASERLEQLRALAHGWRIRVLEAAAPAFGVDTRADYDRFLARLAAERGAG